MRAAFLPLVLLPVACGPIPVPEAEAQCRDIARDVAPRGTVGIGIGSGGRVSGGVGVSLSGDLRGRRPGESFAECVIRKSGEPPFLPTAAGGE